ncbi:MAG: 4-alpha-glucanotransferase [Clostridium sp.]|jgi:4-alpha-glucanotransferase|uniref:4-alpha-glucanotransferase n=1 Tax=Clostridium sp. TaxID=1506 RepID=UPI0025C37AE0|nr:4-alpha-glucanotransferase [Clostridium sp.]MCH3965080.1 4-alpha-glucanotransferase [Clostridium sp.]MCI1714301.1 4-alpha-glucanotransferase [Clostridium sp.]MCI1798563.1 4-alpha-glucanotransferase [Clostridium sp.]MCI1812706.1 4-alpha-glucanotransferase [Clostridium sp.]MCI1869372.1 4-alpha-glucanotransferase [Clostridium sp.]
MDGRSSGILMHITSLPGSYGIGTFGKSACEFVDFLAEAGQKYWQVLPFGPTGMGDSPYQTFSAFAGNPYFIDLDTLNEEGILDKSAYENIDFGNDPEKVDYGKIFEHKMKVLKAAYENSRGKYEKDIEKFRADNSYWLQDYALYMALKTKFDSKPWQYWSEGIRSGEPSEIQHCKIELDQDVKFWIFLQYMFFKQWNKLKSYAHENGIKIIGDIPIYAAEDSADTWSHRKVFSADAVSGCPPDEFSDKGQLWGNPVYRWDYLKSSGYRWWLERLKKNSDMYDVVRIDHFKGFESFWQIPRGEKSAANGKWVKGPGIEFFRKIKEDIKNMDIIAEDLGYLTDDVIKLREESGYPGMKVLEFAFDSAKDSIYLPHNHERNCVVYTGTHDNEPVMGWIQNTGKENFDFAKRYLGLSKEEGYNWGFIRGALSSVAELAVIPLQDYLGLGDGARMNTPSTMGENWKWRIKRGRLTEKLAHKIKNITEIYGR